METGIINIELESTDVNKCVLRSRTLSHLHPTISVAGLKSTKAKKSAMRKSLRKRVEMKRGHQNSPLREPYQVKLSETRNCDCEVKIKVKSPRSLNEVPHKAKYSHIGQSEFEVKTTEKRGRPRSLIQEPSKVKYSETISSNREVNITAKRMRPRSLTQEPSKVKYCDTVDSDREVQITTKRGRPRSLTQEPSKVKYSETSKSDCEVIIKAKRGRPRSLTQERSKVKYSETSKSDCKVKIKAKRGRPKSQTRLPPSKVKYSKKSQADSEVKIKAKRGRPRTIVESPQKKHEIKMRRAKSMKYPVYDVESDDSGVKNQIYDVESDDSGNFPEYIDIAECYASLAPEELEEIRAEFRPLYAMIEEMEEGLREDELQAKFDVRHNVREYCALQPLGHSCYFCEKVYSDDEVDLECSYEPFHHPLYPNPFRLPTYFGGKKQWDEWNEMLDKLPPQIRRLQRYCSI